MAPDEAQRELAAIASQQQVKQPIKTYGACEQVQKSAHHLAQFERANSLKPTVALVERLARHIPGLGILLALCASFFLGTAGMLVKLTTSVHGIQVAVFRAMIQLIIYSAIISVRRIGWLPKRHERLAAAMRALLGGASITLSYTALQLIPLGDATTIRFSLPIWTLIMGYFFLGESCSLYKVCAVVISVLGVVLIAKPDECLYLFHLFGHALGLESDSSFEMHAHEHQLSRLEDVTLLVEATPTPTPLSTTSTYQLINYSNNETGAEQSIVGGQQLLYSEDTASKLIQFEGCMMALASSICLSLSMIALRMCTQTPAEITIWWLSLASVTIGTFTLLLLNEWRLPDNLLDLAFILLNGLCGSIGQWFITSALKVEQSGIISLARTCDIEIAFLYSALLLGEQIRPTSIVGSVLVSTGVIIVVLPKLLGSRSNRSISDASTDESATPASTTDDSSHQQGRPSTEIMIPINEQTAATSQMAPAISASARACHMVSPTS